MLDARQLKNEAHSRCAIREFSLWLTKIRNRRQFGEGFILGKNSPRKKSQIGHRFLDFFPELLDWQVTDWLRRCISLRARACTYAMP
jgi:hypothetical protein